MSQSTKPHAPETKAAIVAEAAALFSQRGYGRTKVVDIARAVGITPPSLYWHFASKEDILFEYLHSGLVEFNRRMAVALVGHESSTDRLRALADAHTRAQLEFRDQAQAVLSVTHSATQLSADLSSERLAQIRTLIREHIDRARDLVNDGIASGEFSVPDVTALTFAMLNVCEYSALWFHPEGGSTVEDVARANGEFAVRMAVGAPGPRTGTRPHDDT